MKRKYGRLAQDHTFREREDQRAMGEELSRNDTAVKSKKEGDEG